MSLKLPIKMSASPRLVLKSNQEAFIKSGTVNRLNQARKSRGFSLIEVLVLVVVLGIVGAAAGQALQAVARTPVTADETFQIETQLISHMEELRAATFDSILVGSTTSTISIGDPTVGGKVTYYQMTTTVSLADADANGLADATFKQISITCGGQTITTLITR